MYEIWIEEAGKELHRQTLSTGQFNLGRSKDNQIYVPYRGVSRQHLRLDVGENEVTVTDLGSTNGTRLNGQTLQPYQSTGWPLQDRLQIGGLTIQIRPLIPMAARPGLEINCSLSLIKILLRFFSIGRHAIILAVFLRRHIP